MAQQKYKFQYREFYDVPRVMLIVKEASVIRLESLFDEERDDYDDSYVVTVAAETTGDLEAYWVSEGDTPWTKIGLVPVHDVTFDHTKRSFFVSPRLDGLLASVSAL